MATNLADAKKNYNFDGIGPEGYDRDEYPFKSVTQGGVGADNEYIPSRDNQAQGADLSQFYRIRLNRIRNWFLVRVIP